MGRHRRPPARLDAEAARRQAELSTVQAGMAKLQTMLPLARQREDDFQSLAAQGFVAGHAGQDRTRERIELERDLATQQARLAEAQAALDESRQATPPTVAETQRALSDRQAKATLDLAQLQQQGAKTAQREQLTQLTAPVAGTVQQLAMHSPGGVVTPAQTLMVIVPDEGEVTAEVVIENKDIGFVHAGAGGGGQAGDLQLHALRHGAGDGEPDDGRCGERREARRHLPGDAAAGAAQHRRRWQGHPAEPGHERDGGDQDRAAAGDRLLAEPDAADGQREFGGTMRMCLVHTLPKWITASPIPWRPVRSPQGLGSAMRRESE